jgi:hypothetical protein
MMKTVAAPPVLFAQLTVSAALALPVSTEATHCALAPSHALAAPTTRLSVGSKVLTVGVTVTVSRSPLGTETRTIRSRPCVPRQLFPVVDDVKSFAKPASDCVTVKGNESTVAVSQRSPVTPPPEHAPLLQVCAPEQVVQALPPLPHAEVEVPLWHTSPWQQPPGQVFALHVATHEVPLHTVFVPQLAQVAPPVPQAVAVVPDWHTLPWQHPSGQVLALQAATHCVPLQLSPEAQAAHVAPPVPQTEVVLPGWHTLPAQQPEGQVMALQVEPPAHSPLLHVCPLVQAVQLSPLAPHAAVVMPGWHTLP